MVALLRKALVGWSWPPWPCAAAACKRSALVVLDSDASTARRLRARDSRSEALLAVGVHGGVRSAREPTAASTDHQVRFAWNQCVSLVSVASHPVSLVR